MAIFSPLRMRRAADRSPAATRRFITFWIGQYACAISIDQVIKATFMDGVYTDAQYPQLFMTRYKGKELLLLDAGKDLFGEPTLVQSSGLDEVSRHLLIVRMAADQAVGVPINSAPATQNIAADEIQPPPAKLSSAIEAIFMLENTRYFVLNLASL